MNVLKSEILPIRCEGIDVQTVLGQFQGRITTMSCTYLSLPLRIGRLKRDDEQILVDKVASRLPRWKGRLLNKAGWLALVNLVLSSLVLHHMTVFQLSKWALKRDRIRHMLVARFRRYQKRVLPRQLEPCATSEAHGRLLDLERFNRALRLRWSWLQWKNQCKPWANLGIQLSTMEVELFRTCTSINLSNGD
jgi:hypothetical protein